eukprot:gene23862-10017_t
MPIPREASVAGKTLPVRLPAARLPDYPANNQSCRAISGKFLRQSCRITVGNLRVKPYRQGTMVSESKRLLGEWAADRRRGRPHATTSMLRRLIGRELESEVCQKIFSQIGTNHDAELCMVPVDFGEFNENLTMQQ